MKTNSNSVRSTIEPVAVHPIRRKLLTTLVCAAVASLSPISILAQSQSAADRLSARTINELEEVIVTARKREESLQDVPVSVAAITGQQIEAQGILQVLDLTNKLPNFQMQTSTPNGLTSVTVRGVEASVRNAGFRSSVSFYVDGIYQGRPLNFSQDLVDISRVELLLGPQGTLFGNNTIAGVLNIVTRPPEEEFGGFAQVQMGNYGYQDYRTSVNIPLVADKWFLRLTGAVTDRDGYQKNVNTGIRQGDLNRTGGRAQLLGKFERTNVLFIADYQGADEHPAGIEYTKSAVTAGVPNFVGPRYTISQDGSMTDVERKGLAFKLDHSFDHGGTLYAISSWKDTDSEDFLDQDGSSDPRLRSNVVNNENQRLISQELRYESDQSQALRYTVGGYYLNDRVILDRVFNYEPPLVVLGPLGDFHFQIPTYSEMESDSYAAFGNLEFDLQENLTISAGLRYSKEEQDVLWQQNEILLALGGVPSSTLVAPPATGILVANAPPYNDSQSDSSVSGTATLTYRFQEGRSAYVRYARGTKSGGFNLEPLPDPLPPTRGFGPETLDSYELGFKSEWLNRRLLVNVAGFWEDYRDLQRADVIPLEPVGFTRVIRNTGKVEIKGAEVELVAVPLPGLQLRGTFGYSDAKYKEYVTNSGIDLSGQQLGGVPKWNASLGLNYTREISTNWAVFFDASADLRGKRQLGPSDATSVSVDGYKVADARIGVLSNDGAWEFALWAKNLFDEAYVTARSGGNDFWAGEAVAYGLPRMYGASVRYYFGAR